MPHSHRPWQQTESERASALRKEETPYGRHRQIGSTAHTKYRPYLHAEYRWQRLPACRKRSILKRSVLGSSVEKIGRAMKDLHSIVHTST